MKIKVTQEDIEDGKIMDVFSCPVALAIVRSRGKRATVGLTRVFLPDKGKVGKNLKLPTNVYRFIKKFDAGENVKPFTFNLKLR